MPPENASKKIAKRGLESICISETSNQRSLRLNDESSAYAGARKLATKIALHGGQVDRRFFQAQWTPYCDNPYRHYVEMDPRKTQKRALEVLAYFPCRKCEKCLQIRQMVWRDRAMSEIALAKRTWFVTLTFSPGQLLVVHGEKHKYGKLERAAYSHVRKYLARLRKQKGLRFRYLFVFERGEKTGRPHFHGLIHEVGTSPLFKRTIERQWSSPVVHARLVRGLSAEGRNGHVRNVASYITKYATKDLEGRIRASRNYGFGLPLPLPVNNWRNEDTRAPG